MWKIFIKHKFIALVAAAWLLLVFCYLILSVVYKPISKPAHVITPTLKPQFIQERFSVIKTFPANGEASVYPGEITITINTTTPVVSKDGFFLDITPKLPYYWKYTNSYPTTTITAQIYGGLELNTQYQLTLYDNKKLPVYVWSFITSSETPESSTAQERALEENLINEYYPLFKSVPYNTTDFSLDYYDRLILIVKVKNKNKNIEIVKKEVDGWIKSKGVDPSTHTIRYE